MSGSSANGGLAGRFAAVAATALAASALVGAAESPKTPAPPAQTSQKPSTAGTSTADLVITGGKIYTVDAARSTAQALAVKGGKIVYVGDAAGAQRWIGAGTKVEQLGSRLVLPGLIDSHIHPLDIVDLDVCDLGGKALSLKELSTAVAQCLTRYKTQPGQRLVVHHWSYTAGNQPDSQHPTLRAALDAASTKVQIQLLGTDYHHGAFNSLALAQAKNAKGQTLGLSKATLAGEFASYQPFVGVDASGEPNGAVNEDARYLINAHSMIYTDLADVLKAPERVPQRLNSVGITGILDAMAGPDGTAIYDKLIANGTLTTRVRLAQFYDPSRTRLANGAVDYDSIFTQAKAIRAKYATNPLIHADFIKLFADGVLEGNPFAVPPTLPNAAALKPFLQPIFGTDAAGHATVKGYVDTASATCADIRANAAKYAPDAAVASFMKEHGYHPAQCAIASGQLQHSRDIILEYIKRAHLAGFNVHIHAISDRSVRTAVDAIEAARAADHISTTRDSLAHLQLVAPSDVERIGRDHLYVAFTYSWMTTDPDYDITVIPFFQKVNGNSYAALHAPGSYYESNSYPVKSVKSAGGILAAGSDAPVDTADPHPFLNMSRAVTRAVPGEPPLSPKQSISIRDVIEAYTINGAHMLDLQDAGSLEVGKSADFIVVDQDILALADGGHPEAVADTRVLSTWFQGKKVYEAPPDIIYINATVYTVDGQDSVQEALAVRGGRIAYVGSNTGAKALAGPQTKIVDLHGRMVMPGLIDGHMHPLEGGLTLIKCNLNYERLTVPQFQARIQACLDKTRAAEPDQWLEVVSWFQQDMQPAGVTVGHETLDALKTHRPIAVMSSFGHSVLANQRALQLGKIDAHTPDPLGGKIQHAANGEPSGILEDAAYDRVTKLVPPPTAAENLAAARAAQEALRQQGITTFLDAAAAMEDIESFTKIQQSGNLTVRAHFAVPIRPATDLNPDKAVAGVKAVATRFDQGPTRPAPTISVRNAKLFLDGVITYPAFTGAMLEPYLENQGTAAQPHWVPGKDRGPPVYFPAPKLAAILLGLAHDGIEPHMHADGDRAVRAGLDAIAALRKEFPESTVRAAIAHDEIVDPTDFPRYKTLGAIPVLSFQWEKPAADTVDGAQDYLGPARFKYMEPAGYLAAAGARITFGSDWPVDKLDEWFALKVGATRENDPEAGAKYRGRLSSDAGLSVPTVIRAITANSAYELHEEANIGSLEPGKLADFIVLDRNLLKIPPQQIAAVKVLLTVVGGQVVYQGTANEGAH